MSLGPFDELFAFLSGVTGGDLHIAALLVLLLLVLALEAGYRFGRLVSARHSPDDGEKSSVNFASAGMIGLLAFLLGVSLSMASGRYEQRRDSVLNEANAIGTSWLRTQISTGAEGEALRRLLRDYTEVRIAAVRGGATESETDRINQRTGALQTEMWQLVRTVAERSPTAISAQLVTSFNDTFDLATTNRRNFSGHVPPYITRLLLTVSLFAVGSVGYGFGLVGTRQFGLAVLLLGAWTLAIILILDVDRPQSGQVRVDPAPLIWTLQGFGPGT